MGVRHLDYKFKPGAVIPASAQVCGEVCEDLASRGMLTGKNLVDVSRPEDAPLHGCFEWDDGIAAEKYREHQGNRIIRALEVPIERGEKEEPKIVRAFFPTGNRIESGSRNRAYEPIRTIIKDYDKTAELLERALQELRSFRNKYAGLKEIIDIDAPVKAVEEMLSDAIKKRGEH